MLSVFQRIWLGLAIAALVLGQGPGTAEFNAAYQALAAKDYDSAIAHFRTGLGKQPEMIGIHKDLAYTLLKTGENAAAREEFEKAFSSNENDEQAALEYAFLAYETCEPMEARRVFDKLRNSGSPNTRKTAEQAFQNIEGASLASRSCNIPKPNPQAANPPAEPSQASASARSADLWAFFDSAYRSRADLDYLAQRWRDGGISVLYVAAWHNLEPGSAADGYLAKLIDACHGHGILVYAWLELPYVSEKFWADHAAWREKTALHQDARIGWRKLMNLQNPECSRAAAQLVQALLERFDWDGVNLAELAFESQAFESQDRAPDPASFTPMNDNVRAEFKEIADFDPMLLFDPASAHAGKKNLQTFLGFREVLALRLQSEWLRNLEAIQKAKPYLDLVLTYRDGQSNLIIGTPSKKKIGVDLSAAEENGQLLPAIHRAAESSSRVALNAENTIEPANFPLIGAAASTARLTHPDSGTLQVESAEQARIEWPGPAAVDGRTWPLRNSHYIITPAGRHTISPGSAQPPFTITDFNGDIQSVTVSKREADIAYQSRTRTLTTFDANLAIIEVDGAPFWKSAGAHCSGWAMLPAGQHLATFIRQ